MLTVLKVIGLILLVILLIVLFLLMIPRSIWVEYDKIDGLTVKVRVFCFKLKVFPLKKGKKKEDEEISGEKKVKKKRTVSAGHKVSEDGEQEKKKSITDDIRFSFDLVGQVLETASEGMKRVLRGIKLRNVSFTLPVSGRDSRTVRHMHGLVSSAFYNLNTIISQVFDIEYGTPKIIADFTGAYSESLYFYCRIIAMPIRILAGGLYLLFRGRKILKENKKVITDPDGEEAEARS